MSRLRELRVHGFKTFADPTRFMFERGITAVIGPNGSGKSNMADAIRWVLGEQSNRSLRMRKAEDVIFAGSQQRRPQGMAEATLTLDNADRWLPTDFAEVSIGRRIYRSGESEYLLNGARVRLREIVELLGEGRLGATDLVVVGQGTVDSALSLRPEERRQLFEEAAGVKALQVRKNEALSRLAAARDNLVRVRDLISELRPQVRRLALQAEHQERHDDLARTLVALLEASHQRREASVRDLLGQAARESAAADAALAAFERAQSTLEDRMRSARSTYAAAEAEAADATAERERAQEARIREEAQLDSLRERERDLSAGVAAAERAEAEAEERLAEIVAEGEHPGPGAQVRSTAAMAEAAEAAWRLASAELQSAEDELAAAEERLAAARRARATHDSERLALERGLELATLRQTQVEGERSSAAGEVARLAAALAGAAAAAQAAADSAAAAHDREKAAADVAERTAHDLATRRARRARLEAEIAALAGDMQSREGSRAAGEHAAPPIGERLRAAGWPSLDETVSLDPDQRRAVEAVIGDLAPQALVWDGGTTLPDVADAGGVVRVLASDVGAGAGARFDAGSRERALAAVKGTQTLADWLGERAAPMVFRTTVLAPDLESLLAGWRGLPHGWTAITPEGDVADARGLLLLHGRADGDGARRQAAPRAELLPELRQRAGTEARALAGDERAAARAGQALNAAREVRRTAERRAHDAAAAADTARARHERAAWMLESLEAEATRAAGEVSLAAERLAAGIAAMTEPGDATLLEEDVRALGVRREATRQAREAARRAWDAARQDAERVDRDHRAVAERIARAEAERAVAARSLPGQREHLHAVGAQIRDAEETLETHVRLAAEATERRDAAVRARDAAREELAGVEAQSAGASAQLAQLQAAAQRAGSERARHEEALAALRREREVALEGLSPPPGEPGDPAALPADVPSSEAELDAELRRVRRALAQIGSVNPFAVSEHRELGARLDGLTEQESDLQGALESTEGLVKQLEVEIAERFAAAFRAIGAAFDDFARILFAGGSASVRMTDDGDGSASAIEIAVRPPGKRLQPLSSLSGGERALAGVALLFAMLTVHPVPFCVLDEVDAALDEANIGRFAEALRRLSASTDFVVVTHNRATIEMADTIYGVTMTDAAVSRVLSLRLSDVPLEATG